MDEIFNDDLVYNPVNIKIVGVGGCGNNMVDWIKRKNIKYAETIAINTDKQQLYYTQADKKILIGENVTKGLGSGGDPKKGELAARESIQKIRESLEGADLVYILAGLGGGTGNGAAPVVAEVAKSLNALTITIATLPFKNEGYKRLERAQVGILKLRDFSDSIILIDNNKVAQLYRNLPFFEALNKANEIVGEMIIGIVETIKEPQTFKNLDFADIRSLLEEGGVGLISIGEAQGTNRAKEVVNEILRNPLLDVDYSNAKGALLYIETDNTFTMEELDIILSELKNNLGEASEVIPGIKINNEYKGKIKIISTITGVKSPYLIPGKKNEDIKEKYGIDEL